MGAAVLICRGGERGETIIGELVERRYIRLSLVATSGWLFSYVLGHASAASSTQDETLSFLLLSAVLAIIFSSSVAVLVVRRFRIFTVSYAIVTAILVWYVLFARPNGISNFQLVPAFLTGAFLLLEFFDEPAAA